MQSIPKTIKAVAHKKKIERNLKTIYAVPWSFPGLISSPYIDKNPLSQSSSTSPNILALVILEVCERFSFSISLLILFSSLLIKDTIAKSITVIPIIKGIVMRILYIVILAMYVSSFTFINKLQSHNTTKAGTAPMPTDIAAFFNILLVLFIIIPPQRAIKNAIHLQN